MALFDALIDDLASRYGLGANAGPLVREVLNYVTGSPGGLGGFLDKLKAAGFGSEVESWLGHADASPVSAQLLDRVVGSTALGGIASRLGLGTSLVSTAVGYALPKLIGLLTPGGTIPAFLSSEVRNFLSAPAAQRVAPATHVLDQVAPRHIEVIHDEPHMTRWLWGSADAAAPTGAQQRWWRDPLLRIGA
jgi:OmpA-OmpF porin, OOP family